MGLADLESLIHRIGTPQAMAWGMAEAGGHGLFPDETAAMTNAQPARRAEFAAGRRAARQAMARLGLPPAPVPMAPDRAPVWPTGLVGSISHAGGLCLAVVARATAFAALGVDLESDAPLDPDLISEICLPEELVGLPEAQRGGHAARIFSAKEAAYKAHYPRARLVFGFHGLHVDMERGCARFTSHPEVAAFPPESRAELPLQQATGGGLILSLCAVPAPAS
ncbi:4'-phosphopantetheinyl transferase superfamily protein [Mameliella alba]|nr:4'-phosphopantetheinyl transferase superfamily protein [Mameliella alba]MBY6168100.1 4'-phosphopantetheinyl transferase superfamily protein [Mameliella alba]MBY6173121.1 4'-phosphopantetheinyl transferase superfamily protein [Mameliella alba]